MGSLTETSRAQRIAWVAGAGRSAAKEAPEGSVCHIAEHRGFAPLQPRPPADENLLMPFSMSRSCCLGTSDHLELWTEDDRFHRDREPVVVLFELTHHFCNQRLVGKLN